MNIDSIVNKVKNFNLKSNFGGWKFSQPKNILVLKNKSSLIFKEIFPYKNVFEYFFIENKKILNEEDLIFKFNKIVLENNIDVIICNDLDIEFANRLNNISLGRRGLLRKEIGIISDESI